MELTNNRGAAFSNAALPSHGEIAVYAYLIWEREGRPAGRAEQHWLEAEHQLLAARAHDANGCPATPVLALPAPTRSGRRRMRPAVESVV